MDLVHNENEIKNKRIIFFGDYHFGVKQSNEKFQKYIIDNWMFMIEYAREHNIKVLIGLGDLFDNRNALNHKTIEVVKNLFSSASDLEFILICGNHDSHFRKSNKTNSPNLILGNYPNVDVIFKVPSNIKINNTSIDLIPWINEENYEETISFIKKKKSKNHIALGHFEIIGFELVRGVIEREGMNPKTFKNYSAVFSGHYHLKSTKGNINYIGSGIQTTWNDYMDNKGFVVYDTEDNSYFNVFGNNSLIHQKMVIGEHTSTISTKKGKTEINYDKMIGKILKIYVNRKLSAAENHIIEELCNEAVADEIIDNTLILSEIEDAQINISDNLEVLTEYVKELDIFTDAEQKEIIQILAVEFNEVQLMEKR